MRALECPGKLTMRTCAFEHGVQKKPLAGLNEIWLFFSVGPALSALSLLDGFWSNMQNCGPNCSERHGELGR